MPIQRQIDVTAVGTTEIINVGFGITGVKISNPSGMWLYVSELYDYIPPNTLNWAGNLEHKQNSINLQMIDAPVGGVASVVSGGPITVYVYETPIQPSLGVNYTIASQADVTAVVAAVSVVAANQAGQATEAKQITQETKLDTVVANTQLPNNQPVNETIAVLAVATLLRTTVTKEAIAISNDDDTDILYIGPATVTTSGANKGLPVFPGGAIAYDLDAGVSIYGVTDSAPLSVTVQRIAST